MFDKFKPGDVVQLKSGGPLMTVMGRTQYGVYACEWFDKNHVSHSDTFAATSLISNQDMDDEEEW